MALFSGRWVTLSANFRWKGTSPPNHCWYQKTGVFLLPHSEDRMILSSFIWIGYQHLTDRQTDGRNCHSYYSALHCKQCSCALKKTTIFTNNLLPNDERKIQTLSMTNKNLLFWSRDFRTCYQIGYVLNWYLKYLVPDCITHVSENGNRFWCHFLDRLSWS